MDYRPLSPAIINQHITEDPITIPIVIQQVQPLLGTTHHETQQLQSANQPHDIAEILGTTAFQGYVDTPLKTLDGLCINQP